MVARLIAIATVLVIGGAPVVATACEGICAARAGDSATAPEHHSCHHDGSTPNGSAITSTTPLCGHSAEGPSAVGQPLWLLAVPAVVGEVFTFAAPFVSAPRFEAVSDHGPPLASLRSTQLRI